MKSYLIVLGAFACLLFVGDLTFGQQTAAENLALKAKARADSQYRTINPAQKAIDGKFSDDSRWVSKTSNKDHWLILQWPETVELHSMHLYSGINQKSPIKKFVLQQWRNQKWSNIPGAMAAGNKEIAVRLIFESPAKTKRVRLLIRDKKAARVKELQLFGKHPNGSPELLSLNKQGEALANPASKKHWALVNQIGYSTNGYKSFTAPLSPDGTTYELIDVATEKVVAKGVIENRRGNFSGFTPPERSDYKFRLKGKDLSEGESPVFSIRPGVVQEAAMLPALQFMNDARSAVGTHASAHGDRPWRNGTYYSHEIPSLVMMYLGNPGFFENAPIEIRYSGEKRRVLNGSFRLKKRGENGNALKTTFAYYKKADAPVGERVPDIIQLIHWGVAFNLLDPTSVDPTNGT